MPGGHFLRMEAVLGAAEMVKDHDSIEVGLQPWRGGDATSTVDLHSA